MTENVLKLSGKQIAIACLVLYLGACVALRVTMPAETRVTDRGILFPHAAHTEDMDCTVCHDFGAAEPMVFDHAFCANCHEIPEDAPSPEACGLCHTREDYEVLPRERFLMADLKFEHPPHAAQEVVCSVCHPEPDSKPFFTAPAKPFCMDCHGDVRPELNECSVCHNEIDESTIPQFRLGMRIAHDAPEVWETIHGREARMDAAYCAMCHDREAFCQDCHDTNPPADHTLTWRRRTHGLMATWDRQNCSVCHEESSCLQCHQNTRPTSHRGRFGAPVNTHCASCHFPAEQNNCTVCHEDIAHPTARPSPHLFGIYPPNCAECHPGGIPTRAPHVNNSSVRCVVCHS